MDKYIQHLNALYTKEQDFNELYIDNIMGESYEYHTKMAKLIKRYSSLFYGENKTFVSEEDYLILIKTFPISYTI